MLIAGRADRPNFIQLGSKPVLQKPANSRLGTKSEKVMRFWDKRGLRRLSVVNTNGGSQEPKAKSPAWCGASGRLKACWAGLRSLYWRERDSNPRYLAVRLISSTGQSV